MENKETPYHLIVIEVVVPIAVHRVAGVIKQNLGPAASLDDVLPAGAVDVDVWALGQLVRPPPRVLRQLLLAPPAEEERGGVGGEGVVLEELALPQAPEDPT